MTRKKERKKERRRSLHLGTYHACKAHLKDVPWLSEEMLDYHNKQCWPGVLAIFSIKQDLQNSSSEARYK